MIKLAKGCTLDDDVDDEEEFLLKKETPSPIREGELRVKVDGKSNDQKPDTPRSKHSATEQRRRSKINDRFQMLRELIPRGDQKKDKASFLLEVIEYIQFLLPHIFAQVKMSQKNFTKSHSWFKKFQYDPNRDSPSDARNVLLVVVALIAAVTFQAGVNPPGGVWQDDGNGTHVAGTAIYASHTVAFYVFLVSNTLALSTCILVITSLTYRFPFHLEIWIATASMMLTYASAVVAVTSESVRHRYLLITASVPFGMRCLGYFFKKYCMSDKDNQIGSQEEGDKRGGQAGQQA